MRYGVREICDVVLRAKVNGQKIGDKTFNKNEPVCYFDSLKTSSLEGAATTVYAQGGKGNPRLVSWEGERTITFKMEDALISPMGFAILSGAGLIDASATKKIFQHATEQLVAAAGEGSAITVEVSVAPSADANADVYAVKMDGKGDIIDQAKKIESGSISGKVITLPTGFVANDIVLVDYYVEKTSGIKQIDIEAGKFGGNYYLEASTLFRSTDGKDYPAEFIIPNCNVQSNFTFTMAASGDPSTFAFTIDAFPDYTRFDKTKKVIAALQIVEE